jgi:hypothetical protein
MWKRWITYPHTSVDKLKRDMSALIASFWQQYSYFNSYIANVDSVDNVENLSTAQCG